MLPVAVLPLVVIKRRLARLHDTGVAWFGDVVDGVAVGAVGAELHHYGIQD